MVRFQGNDPLRLKYRRDFLFAPLLMPIRSISKVDVRRLLIVINADVSCLKIKLIRFKAEVVLRIKS